MSNDLLFELFAVSTLAASLFNVLIMGWLGLTVLLNAERPRRLPTLLGFQHPRLAAWRIPARGTLLAAAGLLLGAVFFGVHAASLDVEPSTIIEGKGLWWFALSLPVVLLPSGWYLLMLWQAGVRDNGGEQLRLRHRFLIGATIVLGTIITVLLILTYPRLDTRHLPPYAPPLPPPYGTNGLTFIGARIVMVVYAPYIMVCTIGALDALRHPAPSGRLMGEVARRRARPYLVASSLVQLAISLLVATTLFRFFAGSLTRPLYSVYAEVAAWVAAVELSVSLLVGVTVVLLGKAIVSYEIFTGKPLPRRGFLRQWRAVVAGAMGYSLVLAWACDRSPGPIVLALLPTAFLSAAIAAFAWRANAERDETMAALRPLVASQHLYDRLVDGDNAVGDAAHRSHDAFATLCRDVLDAQCGFLCALGAMAPFAGAPLAYPFDLPAPDMAALRLTWRTPLWCIPVNTEQYGGASWAVALSGEDGLIGILLLGDKRDGSLYTLEELEVARLAGERLLDARAGAELAGRLMALQRRRLAETRLLDRGTRRALHDDVLPRIHAAMLCVGACRDAPTAPPASHAALDEALTALAEAHRDIAALLREMPTASHALDVSLNLAGALQRTTREMQGEFAAIAWEVDEHAAERARDLPPLVAETLFYAVRESVRNAARHARPALADGIANGKPSLHIALQWYNGLQIAVTDDGTQPSRNTQPSGESGETPSPVQHSNSTGGSGAGLALHSAMMAVVGGELSLERLPEGGTRALTRLPEKEFAGWARATQLAEPM